MINANSKFSSQRETVTVMHVIHHNESKKYLEIPKFSCWEERKALLIWSHSYISRSIFEDDLDFLFFSNLSKLISSFISFGGTWINIHVKKKTRQYLYLPLHSVLLWRVFPTIRSVKGQSDGQPDGEPDPGLPGEFHGQEGVHQDGQSWQPRNQRHLRCDAWYIATSKWYPP